MTETLQWPPPDASELAMVLCSSCDEDERFHDVWCGEAEKKTPKQETTRPS